MALHGGKISDIGHMDRVIEVYNRISADTDFGFTDTDTLLHTIFAEEIPRTRTMREGIAGGKESSVQEIHWRVRREDTIDVTNMLKDDNDAYYDIITILNEGRDYKILITQYRPNDGDNA